MPVAAVNETTDSSATIAYARGSNVKKIKTADYQLKVIAVNNVKCNIAALLDTDSPVSFIRPSIYSSLFGLSTSSLNMAARSYKALNNTPIQIIGSVSTVIQLLSLPDFSANINLHVLRDDFLSTYMIIGCDFLEKHSISVLYNLSTKRSENRLQLLSEVAYANIISEGELDTLLSEINIDFDEYVKQQLIALIVEIKNSEVLLADDNYNVKVALRDDSTYAYAPRRFVWSERIQIREITDNLLNKGKIKYSSSPHCARVVSVKKKNGSLRLCVDLHPLNDRVVKQKYPFPLIEDCLARLSNKTVFAVLDLKVSPD